MTTLGKLPANVQQSTQTSVRTQDQLRETKTKKRIEGQGVFDRFLVKPGDGKVPLLNETDGAVRSLKLQARRFFSPDASGVRRFNPALTIPVVKNAAFSAQLSVGAHHREIPDAPYSSVPFAGLEVPRQVVSPIIPLPLVPGAGFKMEF